MKDEHSKRKTALARMIADTHEQELNCAECLQLGAEYAERIVSGAPRGDLEEKVEIHLKLCPECREELLALKKAIQALGSGESGSF